MTSECLPHQVYREISITDAMDTRNAKSHALKAISILKGLEQARFDQIVDAFVEMHFEAGQKVISHGELGSALNSTLHASAHHGALPPQVVSHGEIGSALYIILKGSINQVR